MEEMTSAARAMEAACGGANEKDKSRCDTCVKEILADKWFLAWILRDTAKEFRGRPIGEIRQYIEGEPVVCAVPVDPGIPPDRIRGGSQEDKVVGEGFVTFDICFDAVSPPGPQLQRNRSVKDIKDTGTGIRLIINVEGQKSSNVDYSLIRRGIFYCARLISRQKDREFRGMHYNDIRKVYSIWIVFDAGAEEAHTITTYSMSQHNEVGSRPDREEYDLLTVAMVCLGKEEPYEKGTLLGMLETVFSGKLSIDEKKRRLGGEYGIPMTRKVEEGLTMMYSYSAMVEKRGYDRGLEQGIAEGEARGEARGRAIGEARGEARGQARGQAAARQNYLDKMTAWFLQQEPELTQEAARSKAEAILQ